MEGVRNGISRQGNDSDLGLFERQCDMERIASHAMGMDIIDAENIAGKDLYRVLDVEWEV